MAVCASKVAVMTFLTRSAVEVDVCALIESMGVSKFINVSSAVFVVGEFVAFVFLTLLCIVREVLTEGFQDRVWFKWHLVI